MDQPSPKRTTLETTLKSVPNDLDDMIHTRLDQEVLGSFKVTDVEPPNIDILSAVVENSEGRLDPRYLKHRELRELVGEYPELEDKLSMAWRAGSFKEIRNLSSYNSAQETLTNVKRSQHLVIRLQELFAQSPPLVVPQAQDRVSDTKIQ